ncbi:MAG TPA: patatin-like protein [Pyrinomonadaceae bacterium]|nr:patatin-like protein [Pyrinomonadaceae bacterium]
MSNTASPQVDYTREVRFAVVMYGGVSLAIYINGIAQEMLRWVRSTAKHPNADVALLPSNPSTSASAESELSLSGTERVYRKLSYILANQGTGKGSAPELLAQAEKNLAGNEPIRTRFVVDILSGTSAGGINGIFLGKALANGQDISGLENLWIEEGDMKTLLNDKQSVRGRPLKLQDPPASLLNSQRMYLELLKAFDSMEETGGGSAPFVDELDLFVTTTDLSGVTLPIRLSDGVVYERRHRNVLRFVYSNKDASAEAKDRNDFEAKFNPFLAYAARCTSAFPAAFEPMCLCDTDAILKSYHPYANNENCRSESSDWQRFYKDYLNPAGVNTVKFPKRAFADGGYLDNKPFTYATETVARRQADLLITRKLIYIEPSPEHPEEQPDAEGKPDAIENVGAALLSLPRYETIREDLQRVRDHNRLVERVNSILKSVEVDKKLGKPPIKRRFNDEEWGKLDLAEVVTEKGVGYVAYHRLDISAVSDDLAKLVTRVAGFDEESDHFMVIRSLVGAWRANTYVEHGKGKPSLNQFLFEFNLSYPMRRINFLRTKISELAAADEYVGNAEAQAELVEIKKKLNQEYKNLRRTARLLRSRQAPGKAGAASAGSVPSPAYEAIQNLKAALAVETMKRLPEEVQSKIKDPAESVVEYFLGVRANGATATSGSTIKDECDARARELLKDDAFADLFVPIADALKAQIGPAKKTADKNCRAALRLNDEDSDSGSEPPESHKDSCEYLGYYYQNYDEYDRIIFPIIYGTEIGEAARVDIIRISPEDATALIDEREAGCYKLAGSALGHFGAFLDPLWRRNDIMWGRLDGVERIITALLPDDPKLARLLVGEAQAAIVHETIAKAGEKEARDLLCEAAMRPRSGNPEAKLVTDFIGNLKAYDGAGRLETLIDDKVLRQHYLDTFATRSRLNPESTLKITSRATTVLGKMFSTLSHKRNVDSSVVAWIARAGQALSGLVEVAVPRSMPSLVFRYWLKLLYMFEVLLIVFATLLADPRVSQFGWNLLGITVVVNVAVWLLSDWMSRRHVILRTLLSLLGLSVFLLLLIGALKVLGLVGITIGNATPLGWISQNLQQLLSWFEGKLPTRVWQVAQALSLLIVALFGILIFWRLGKRPGKPKMAQ